MCIIGDLVDKITTLTNQLETQSPGAENVLKTLKDIQSRMADLEENRDLNEELQFFKQLTRDQREQLSVSNKVISDQVDEIDILLERNEALMNDLKECEERYSAEADANFTQDFDDMLNDNVFPRPPSLTWFDIYEKDDADDEEKYNKGEYKDYDDKTSVLPSDEASDDDDTTYYDTDNFASGSSVDMPRRRRLRLRL